MKLTDLGECFVLVWSSSVDKKSTRPCFIQNVVAFDEFFRSASSKRIPSSNTKNSISASRVSVGYTLMGL